MKTRMKWTGFCGAVVAVLTACGAHGASDDGNAGAMTADQTSTHQLSGYDLPQGTFALTFDDGPGARTEELANWLGDRGIVATFFMNGKNAPATRRRSARSKRAATSSRTTRRTTKT